MGLAFYNEGGRRLANTSGSEPAIHGGPYYGKPYFPRDVAGRRLKFTADEGGFPFWRAAAIGSASATNLIANPQFDTDATGWTGVTRLNLGGMFGTGGCGYVQDSAVATADLDGYYTYNKGSAIGTTGFAFCFWMRASVDVGTVYPANKTSIKLRIEDGAGVTVFKSASYREVHVEDGWVFGVLVTAVNIAWTGNIIKCGLEFQTSTGTNKPLIAIDGAALYQQAGSNDHARGQTYPPSTAHLDYPGIDIAYSTREGFLTAFCFPATSPRTSDYVGADINIASDPWTILQFGTGSQFKPRIRLNRILGGDGWVVTFGIGATTALGTITLTGWPHCALHIVLSWSASKVRCGVRGYFKPMEYGLTSNIATTEIDADHTRFADAGTSLLYVGGSDSSSDFDGWIWDVNFGNREFALAEVEGVLLHGPGPYTGTVAWAPLESNTQLVLVEAVSFHRGGPLGLARSSYAPASGLVAVAGSGLPTSDLSRSVTENVIDTFGIIGRLKDSQLTQRAISALSALFEQVHRNNEQGARYSSGVAFSMDTVQASHPKLRHFPAPRVLKSRLVWGNIDIDPRLTSFYGQQGVIWGTVRFERWGFWEGPLTRALLAKNRTLNPALSYTTANFRQSGSTNNPHFFEIPEGIVDGDLEAPCQAYFRSPVSSVLSRIRMARRSRGIPGDVVACYEAESASNTFGGTGGTVVVAAQSDGNVRSSTNTSNTAFDWIKFEVVDQDSDIPDWLFGEWRILAIIAPQAGASDEYYLRARVDMGAGFVGPYGPTVGSGICIGTPYSVLDLGIFRIPSASVPRIVGGLGATVQGLSVVLNIRKAAAGGGDIIYCDCIVLMPADEMYVQVDRNAFDVPVGSGSLLVSSTDGQAQAVMLDAADRFEDIGILRSRGVWVQPGRKNRFWLLVDKFVTSRYDSDPNAGVTVEISYTPRYLLLPSFEGGGGGGWA